MALEARRSLLRPGALAGPRELLFVVSGEIRLTVGDTEYSASAGQTLVFRADEPHRYAAGGRVTAHVIMVVLDAGKHHA